MFKCFILHLFALQLSSLISHSFDTNLRCIFSLDITCNLVRALFGALLNFLNLVEDQGSFTNGLHQQSDSWVGCSGFSRLAGCFELFDLLLEQVLSSFKMNNLLLGKDVLGGLSNLSLHLGNLLV